MELVLRRRSLWRRYVLQVLDAIENLIPSKGLRRKVDNFGHLRLAKRVEVKTIHVEDGGGLLRLSSRLLRLLLR